MNELTQKVLVAASVDQVWRDFTDSTALAQWIWPPRLETTAAVDFEPGKGILRSALTVDAEVPGIDPETFARIAEEAKTGCPVSAALRGLEITLTATLR